MRKQPQEPTQWQLDNWPNPPPPPPPKRMDICFSQATKALEAFCKAYKKNLANGMKEAREP